jgi:hypothetical protein
VCSRSTDDADAQEHRELRPQQALEHHRRAPPHRHGAAVLEPRREKDPAHDRRPEWDVDSREESRALEDLLAAMTRNADTTPARLRRRKYVNVALFIMMKWASCR